MATPKKTMLMTSDYPITVCRRSLTIQSLCRTHSLLSYHTDGTSPGLEPASRLHQLLIQIAFILLSHDIALARRCTNTSCIWTIPSPHVELCQWAIHEVRQTGRERTHHLTISMAVSKFFGVPISLVNLTALFLALLLAVVLMMWPVYHQISSHNFFLMANSLDSIEHFLHSTKNINPVKYCPLIPYLHHYCQIRSWNTEDL